MGKIDLLPVSAGDQIQIQTPGGGGWGEPFARLPEAVLVDVQRGLLSLDAARRDYGVVLLASQAGVSIDGVATEAMRRQPRDPVSRFGAERDAWEQVFPAALLDRFNAALFALPAAVRARKRRQAFGAVLGGLPDGFPQSRASAPALQQAAAHFEREVQACSAPAVPAAH